MLPMNNVSEGELHNSAWPMQMWIVLQLLVAKRGLVSQEPGQGEMSHRRNMYSECWARCERTVFTRLHNIFIENHGAYSFLKLTQLRRGAVLCFQNRFVATSFGCSV